MLLVKYYVKRIYKIIGKNSYLYFIFPIPTKEQTSVVTTLANISDLIGHSFAGEFSCEIIDILTPAVDFAVKIYKNEL